MLKDEPGLSLENPADWMIPLLCALPGLGPARYWRLRHNSLPLSSLLSQPLASLLALMPDSARESFTDFYRHRQASVTWQRFVAQHAPLLDAGVTVLTHEDLRYPELLAEIHQSPPVLYVRGSVAALAQPQLAFVGSRHGSVQGGETTYQFARYLAQVGLGITSGLAQGIDAQAHRGALAADGVTVAVMGTGIDRIYPARHRRLADDIVAGGGALVTEFAPGVGPHSGNFPRRNRIISGLSLGVVVVEAALQSGSLITARCAAEQNREVFAVPGSIHNPLSRGCHHLIREGASLVETAEDIARELTGWIRGPSAVSAPASVSPATAAAEVAEPLTESEQQLLQVLGFESHSFDQLSERLELSASELQVCLMQLELHGLITQQNGHIVRLLP